MFMQHHEPECHAEKLVHCLQCQGYSEGLYNQNITFCYFFWTAGLFATKIGLIVQHHKPECPVEKNWITAVKVKATAKAQYVRECLIGSSDLQNILLPHLVWWCSIMSQSVVQKKNCFLYSRSRSQQGLMWSKYDSFYHIFWTVDSLATKLGLTLYHDNQSVLWKKKWFLHSRSRSQCRVRMSSVCPDDIF